MTVGDGSIGVIDDEVILGGDDSHLLGNGLGCDGVSPVTMITLIPALLHLETASGTDALGGSIMLSNLTNLSLSRGKLGSPDFLQKISLIKTNKVSQLTSDKVTQMVFCTALACPGLAFLLFHTPVLKHIIFKRLGEEVSWHALVTAAVWGLNKK
jgi:hypothetical protein